ncbi:MAG TPA: GNAT family N-acetyltransferase [Chitinophagaceae bacterium]|nr:GNAT family N-acetyltransferase [Chitinophagaceae bacterium]
MEISLRRISARDAADVTALCGQLGYPLSQGQIFDNINAVLDSKDHDAYVATFNDQVVGWIGLAQAIMIESLPFCEINGLVIDENHRGKGIGKLLVERAREWAAQKGHHTVRLRCNIKRTEAHQFYDHLGFKRVKQQTTFEIDPAN